MRIIAGKHRGRRLHTPKGRTVRPTSERTREAVFNVLDHRLGTFADVVVLDAFAGTGAMGIEALSRGAENVTFIEKDRDAVRCLERNVSELEETAKSTRIISVDVMTAPQAGAPVNLLFLDPPYDRELGAKALAKLRERGWIDENTICVLETGKTEGFEAPEGFEITFERAYGKAFVRILRLKMLLRSGPCLSGP